ncbi:MAG: sulfurtransferase [Gemmatimonadota bacterium]
MTNRVVLAAFLLLSGTSALAQRNALPVVVDAGWLQSRLGREPRLEVVHVATSRAEYDAGHLPGARFLPYPSLIVSAASLSTQMAPLTQLDSLMESIGIGDSARVVLYGQPLLVARAFVTMEYLGMRGRVAVLNGGIDNWRESGRPVSNEPAPADAATFTPRVAEGLVVDHIWVQANNAKAGVAIVDARAPEFFLGYSPGQMPRPGHIPGARNVPFGSLTTELTQLRDEGRVRRLFREAGVAAGDTIVTYCHIGLQASLLYLTARRLGHEARLYDGSFEDWSRRTDLPLTVRARP